MGTRTMRWAVRAALVIATTGACVGPEAAQVAPPPTNDAVQAEQWGNDVDGGLLFVSSSNPADNMAADLAAILSDNTYVGPENWPGLCEVQDNVHHDWLLDAIPTPSPDLDEILRNGAAAFDKGIAACRAAFAAPDEQERDSQLCVALDHLADARFAHDQARDLRAEWLDSAGADLEPERNYLPDACTSRSR